MYVAKTQNQALAAGLTLAPAAFVAGTTLLAKALGTGALGSALHPLVISHGRFLFALIAIGGAVAALRPRISGVHVRLHVLRTALGWGGVTLMFAAAAFIPLSDATAISFLNPVFGMMLAILLLGERVGVVRWSAAAIALMGGLILVRPGSGVVEMGALLALGAAVLLGAELIAIKLLSGRENPLQILLIGNAIGFCISGVAAAFVWQMPTAAQWVALAGIGFLMAGAQACFTNAMARADASFVAPFFYATLVFAALYDFAFFDVVPDAVSVIGVVVTLVGVVFLVWREAQLKGR